MSTRKRGTQAARRKRPLPQDDADESVPVKGVSQDVHNFRFPARRSPKAYNQLFFGVCILFVAILVGFLWNLLDPSVDPRVLRFWSQICREAQCARFVSPVRRTLHASRPIRSGEIVSEIPRELQIWDMDALRDDFVRTELVGARHSRTGNRLSSGAFLAAYLALEHEKVQKNANNATFVSGSTNSIRRAYFDALPTLDESSDHPLFWTTEDVMQLLGRRSLSAAVILAHHEMVDSEYTALSQASDEFALRISKTNYTLARVWVLSRSFSPGPQGTKSEMGEQDRTLWQESIGTDFHKGCHVMVPILDLLNHHPSPNVVYHYNTDKRAFVIAAKKTIPAGFELYDSYGQFSDSHLLAKFGFLNGDGSGGTQVSLALFHRLLDVGGMDEEFSLLSKDNPKINHMILEAQRSGLVRYLQYDDGYSDCIPGPEAGDAFRLKELKFLHLLRIANDPVRWIVTLGPRNRNSEPVDSSDKVIMEGVPELDPQSTRVNLRPLIETCRLLSLIHTDFDGDAITILEKNMDAPDFFIDRVSDALEYRAFVCVARLAGGALADQQTTVSQQVEYVEKLNKHAFGDRKWTAAHARLAELQTLQLISGTAFSVIKDWQSQLTDPEAPEYTARDASCPKAYVHELQITKSLRL